MNYLDDYKKWCVDNQKEPLYKSSLEDFTKYLDVEIPNLEKNADQKKLKKVWSSINDYFGINVRLSRNKDIRKQVMMILVSLVCAVAETNAEQDFNKMYKDLGNNGSWRYI